MSLGIPWSQGIEQSGNILLRGREGGAAGEEIISILEESAGREGALLEIFGQGLTKDVRAISEALGQDCPG